VRVTVISITAAAPGFPGAVRFAIEGGDCTAKWLESGAIPIEVPSLANFADWIVVVFTR
jgi:hypothetical protein